MAGRRDLSPEEKRLWRRVASTVAARPGRNLPEEPTSTPVKADTTSVPATAPGPAAATAPRPRQHSQAPVDIIEPRRLRRLARERDPVDGRIDLHGMGRFEAEDRLVEYLLLKQATGARAVLVITGKGRRGEGVIRRSVHDWLMGPRLRPIVSGVAEAHRRHGGEGALYVTLKPRV
ncbi:Smr/MutS family protein [Brevundimonas sp. 2R-24]|uniref:Smr/MutS family protein n=1 Tax=Peiella sedimenti TaxID=3061083 RepID=A0ABT8SNJ0_9CAUL|nr:Smr/MutS family protein [Caulobacteraceae bacterium XZ-24]